MLGSLQFHYRAPQVHEHTQAFLKAKICTRTHTHKTEGESGYTVKTLQAASLLYYSAAVAAAAAKAQQQLALSDPSHTHNPAAVPSVPVSG